MRRWRRSKSPTRLASIASGRISIIAWRNTRIPRRRRYSWPPPGYNPPAPVAERIATLDLISSGRVEWGTGQSASRTELEGFGVEQATTRAQWAEATEQTANLMAMERYPGFQGQFFSMPTRNVVPKPYQTPHPPIWVACSNRETIHAAARNGIGALAFAFIDPAEAGKWASEYYDIIRFGRVHSDRAHGACQHLVIGASSPKIVARFCDGGCFALRV